MQKLKDIMSKNVEVVDPNADLNEVARIMRKENTGAVPVCDGRRIRGMITDRDIVVRALADGKSPSKCLASEVMSREVHYCYEDDTVRDAGQLMQDKQIRRILVVDRDKNLKGIVSIGDLSVSASDEFAGETLEQISGGELHSSRSRSAVGLGGLGGFVVLSGLVGAGYYYLSQNPEVRDRLARNFKDGFNRIRDRFKEELEKTDELAA